MQGAQDTLPPAKWCQAGAGGQDGAQEGKRRQEAGQEMFPRAAALTTTSQHGGSQESQQSSGSGPVDGTKAQALGGHPLILPRADRARQALSKAAKPGQSLAPGL